MGWLASLDLHKPYAATEWCSKIPSDLPKHWHSRQSRALSNNTQGIQRERKGEGGTHERICSSKKRPPANKVKIVSVMMIAFIITFGEMM